MLRALLERLTRDWVFRRSLPVNGRRVPMLVSPSGGLRYLFKPMARVDPALVAAAERYVQAGMIVWDVGANLGLFTFAAAALAGPSGRISAFEPDPWLQRVLSRSCEMQQASAPIDVVGCAVASSCETRTFSLARRSRATSHLAGYGTTQAGGVRGTLEVRAITLDAALATLPRPDVVKIDVEGAEVEVLRGATKVLGSRPTILCEVAHENSAVVTAILRDAGYRLLDGETMRPADTAGYFTIAEAPAA